MPEEVVVKPTEQDTQKEIEAKPEKVKHGGALKSLLDTYKKEPEVEVKEKESVEETKPEETVKPDDKDEKPPEAKEPTVAELKTEKANLLSEIEKLKKAAPEGTNDDFFNDMKDSVLDAFDKHGKTLGLPDVNSIVAEVQKRANMNVEITGWQQDTLIKEIEKAHDIEDGTFVFDPSEAWTKGTPSCQFREETEKKEREIYTRQATHEKARNERMSAVKEQQEKDIDYIKDTFFNGDEETFNTKIEEFNSLAEALEKGDIDKNPFAVRNLFRGYYFDELTNSMVSKAVAEVHKQYEEHGMSLPNTSKTPDSISTVNGTEVISENQLQKPKKHGYQNVMFGRYK